VKILAAVKALRVGDPRDPATDVGPMIDRLKAEEAFRKVQEAIREGAKVLVGGTLEDTMFAPTILTETTPAMRVNKEEVFAPVISISPYDTFDEALRIANASEYGLQVGIFTQNINRAMRAFSEMQVGGVQVNDIPTFRSDAMPWR